jgi:hypothetical protein
LPIQVRTKGPGVAIFFPKKRNFSHSRELAAPMLVSVFAGASSMGDHWLRKGLTGLWALSAILATLTWWAGLAWGAIRVAEELF